MIEVAVIEVAIVAVILAAWAGAAFLCDWARRRRIATPRAKKAPELISSSERVAAYLLHDSEKEAVDHTRP